MGAEMTSRPITPTPRLNVRDSERFLRLVEEGLKNPMGPVPTPGIEKALEKIMENQRAQSSMSKKDIEEWADRLAEDVCRLKD